MKIDVIFRILGSVMVIVGYIVALHLNITAGAIIMSVGDLLAVPFFIRDRAYDVVIMVAFMTTVTISKMITG